MNTNWATVAALVLSGVTASASAQSMVDGVLGGMRARQQQESAAEDREHLAKKRKWEEEDRAWFKQQRELEAQNRAASRSAASPGAAVVLQTAGDDETGLQLARALRGRLAAAIGFRPALNSDPAYLILSLKTLAYGGSSNPGVATAYSASFQFGMNGDIKGKHLSHTVGICGRNKVESCAVEILIDMSRALDADLLN